MNPMGFDEGSSQDYDYLGYGDAHHHHHAGGGGLDIPPPPSMGGMRWGDDIPEEAGQPAFANPIEEELAKEDVDAAFDDLARRQEEEEDAAHPFIASEVPPFACKYCLYHDTSAMARCNGCKKWFCNSNHGLSGSHIITHLVQSRHKEISLHPDSPFGDGPQECFVCGTRNIFMLGFVPSKEDNVVIVLCREPCLNAKTLQDMDWDPSTWVPLIEDKQLLSWFVSVPRSKEMRRCRLLSKKQVVALEDYWKKHPDADFEEMKHDEPVEQLAEIPLIFESGEAYAAAFSSLLDEEASYSRQMTETTAQDSVQVNWENTLSGKKAVFSFPGDTGLAVGSELHISLKSEDFETFGTIQEITTAPDASDLIHLLVKARSVPTAVGGYTVRMTWNPTTFTRMKNAMTTMVREETSLSAYLFQRILGGNPPEKPLKVQIPEDLKVPNLALLNLSQRTAVETALVQPLSLIQGPPGTGKTVTSATLIYHMCHQNNAQVLVCAPSNVAADQLAERVTMTGLNVIRLAAKSRECLESTVDHLTLHVQVEQFCNSSPKHSELRKLSTLKQEIGELNAQDRSKYKRLMLEAEADLIAAADVVVATCSGAGDLRLSTFRFKHVLIDEATQAVEPECLIPICMGAKQVVLVGDHCQMGPVVCHRGAERAGLGRSLFERLILVGIRPIRLDVQYRMHPFLSEFSSNSFYEGTLQNGVTAEQRDACFVFPWPNPRKPSFFYNSVGSEEIGGKGSSYLNRTEAALAERFLTYLLKHDVRPDDVGVITPYEGQRCYLVNYIQRNGSLGEESYRRVEIASVDSFQGREKEFIILTCVRSSEHQGIGFLASWRRLNVALTRAKRGVILIGNARVLARNQLWHSLLTHYKENKNIVDGPMSELKIVDIALPRPLRAFEPIGPSNISMYQSDYQITKIGGATLPHGESSGLGAVQPPPQQQLSSANAAALAAEAEAAFIQQQALSYAPGMAPARHFANVRGAPASQASMSFDTQSQ